ncbi:MAG: aspartate/glutamate racemase family protein [Pseudomonadota bacterium]
MKTIGMIGGMSWESTTTYYQLVNRLTRDRLGGLHSAQLLLWSFDFAAIEALQMAGDWGQATEEMVVAARRLEQGGADCLLICTNTMHKMAADVQSAVNVPLLHIADATALALKSDRIEKPLLLGTRFTMEEDFYLGRLRDQHDVAAITPDAGGRDTVHRVIYDELCQGIVSEASRRLYVDIVDTEIASGADGVILGCTEVGLLLRPQDVSAPLYDTTELHAKAAVDFALST